MLIPLDPKPYQTLYKSLIVFYSTKDVDFTMKWLLRLFLCFSIALFLPLLLLDFHLRDLSDQYQAKQYAIDWFNSWASPTGQTTNATEDYGDKVIVVAKLQEENTDWIEQELPE